MSKIVIKEETFPAENYKFEEMGSNFYGRAAYLNNKCIGIALFDNTYNKYLYLNNIMVSKEYRNTGVGKLLLDEGIKISNKLGKIGVWLVCQSSNVNAFKFYINNGYELGDINTRIYDSTKQEGNNDLFLYKKIIN